MARPRPSSSSSSPWKWLSRPLATVLAAATVVGCAPAHERPAATSDVSAARPAGTPTAVVTPAAPTALSNTAPTTRPSGNEMSGFSAVPPAVPPRWVKPTDFDFPALLGGPPADDSDAHRGELDQVLSLQADRTPAQAARCRAEEVFDVFAFASALGPWFAERDLPVTAALMRQVYVDARAVSDGAKSKWTRARPPLADPRVKPCVKLEPSPSFPSGHATRGAMWAVLLSDAVPDKADALAARGKEIGTNRVLAGMHWPTDVTAGHKLGLEVARRLLADPAFRAEWDEAKAEMAAHRR
jgi:acid phosphatase (class A)